MNWKTVETLYVSDGRARWRVLYTSMLVAFVATILVLLGGASQNESLVVTALVSTTAYVIGITRYKPAFRSSPKRVYSVQFAGLLRPLAKLAVACLVSLVVGLETPNLAAAVLNYRLEVALKIPTVEKRGTETRRILLLAKRSHTTLRKDLLVKVAQSLGKSANDSSSGSADMINDWPSTVAEVARQFNARFATYGDPSTYGRGNDLKLEIHGSYKGDVYSAEIVYDGHSGIDLQRSCFGSISLQIADTANGHAFLKAFASSTDGCVAIRLEQSP